MDGEIAFQLLLPFDDMITKAQAAIDANQTTDVPALLKASQTLLKEGGRCRSKIETIAQHYWTSYSSNFLSALKDHDGISEQMEALDGYVFMFDEILEPEDFDAEKFTELIKSVQQATLKVSTLLKRMKLTAPSPPLTPAVAPAPSVASASPIPGASMSRVNSSDALSSYNGYAPRNSGSQRPYSGTDPLPREEEQPLVGYQSGLDVGWNNGIQTATSTVTVADNSLSRNGSRHSATSNTSASPFSEETPPPPPPPERNPWHIGSLPTVHTIPEGHETDDIHDGGERGVNGVNGVNGNGSMVVGPDGSVMERRRRVSTRPDSPTLPFATAATAAAAAAAAATATSAISATSAATATAPATAGAYGIANGSPRNSSTPTPRPATSSGQSSDPRNSQNGYRRFDDGGDASKMQDSANNNRLLRTTSNASSESGFGLLDNFPLAEGMLSSSASSGSRLQSTRPNSIQPSNYIPIPQKHQLRQSHDPQQHQQHQQYHQQQQQYMQTHFQQPNYQYQHLAKGQLSSSPTTLPMRISTATTATTASTSTSASIFSASNGNSQARESAFEPISPTTIGNTFKHPGSPIAANGSHMSPTARSGHMLGTSPTAPLPELPRSRQNQPLPALPASPQISSEPMQPTFTIDSDPIPVETEEKSVGAPAEPYIPIRQIDCTIKENSSFYQMKGFCEGAKEVIRGGKGVKKIMKPSYSGMGSQVAKCTKCMFELNWHEVEKDCLNMPDVSYQKNGIIFRMRFLSKSHMAAKSIDGGMYACLFCIQLGHTIEESDATVFFSRGQLFEHLTRHPRPLPKVEGVTVIEALERPAEFRNNFDLHFVLPPEKSQLEGIRRELSMLPTGTAVSTFRLQEGSLRRPIDGAIPHQFPIGAKIVGIEFPEKYKGEWAVGWFDNTRAPFPVDFVRLDPPHRSEIRTQGTTTIRATVRWKWGGKAYNNSDWLNLNKNETVFNVQYADPSHWCYSGTTAKGKWGIFPQSHIEPGSLRDTADDKESINSFPSSSVGANAGGGGGFLTRFRPHNNHNHAVISAGVRRPMSVASSSTASS